MLCNEIKSATNILNYCCSHSNKISSKNSLDDCAKWLWFI